MANKIILKKTSTASKVPLSTDLEVGEIAVNLADQKLYSKNAGGTVILVGSGASAGDVVGPSSATDNALVRFDTTTGKLIQNGVITQDDNGTLANVNAIGFDTTPTSAPTTTGSMYWDNGNQAPTVVLNANIDLQLGQENVALVYNDTGSTIAKGSVVAVSGAQGQRPSVVLADADSEALSASTLGITAEAIANGAEGFVCTFGLVRGLNTSAFTAGQAIYLSQTAGAFTATRPSAPAHTVALGYVISINASSGEVFVNINNGWELDELHNVLITSPASGNTLIYDAVAGVWENANLTAGTGISVTNGAGSITLANTGVTSAVAGTGVSVSGSTGAVTFNIGQAVATSSNVEFNSLGVGTAGSATAGEIRATNNVTAYYSSDRKWKENIQPIQNALQKVESIGGKTFDWTKEYTDSHGGVDGYFIIKEDFGVIAQDVQQVFPQAVRIRKDGTLAVDYAKLSALALQAIAELSTKVSNLERKLKD